MTEEQLRKALGDELKAAREKLGLTQDRLAKKWGLSQFYISQAERGETTLRDTQLKLVIHMLEHLKQVAPATATLAGQLLWGEDVEFDEQGHSVKIPVIGDSGEGVVEMSIADASKMMSLMRERFPSDSADLTEIERIARAKLAKVTLRLNRRDRDHILKGAIPVVMDAVTQLGQELHDAREARELAEQHRKETQTALEQLRKKLGSETNEPDSSIARLNEQLSSRLDDQSAEIDRLTADNGSKTVVIERLREANDDIERRRDDAEAKLKTAKRVTEDAQAIANTLREQLRIAERRIKTLQNAAPEITCGTPEDHEQWGERLEAHLEMVEAFNDLANQLDGGPFGRDIATAIRTITEKYGQEKN